MTLHDKVELTVDLTIVMMLSLVLTFLGTIDPNLPLLWTLATVLMTGERVDSFPLIGT